jgi:hypothetical protein
LPPPPQGSAAVSFDFFARVIRAATGSFSQGENLHESVWPDNTDPVPLRNSPPGMGTVMIRFVGLLIVAVAVQALAWSR